jgi:hypothetical protein
MTFLGGCAATVSTPPPTALVEVRPVVPFYGAVWIDGCYEHRHNRYVWVPGRYVRPPHPRAAWVPGHWQQHPRGWKWNRGYWR